MATFPLPAGINKQNLWVEKNTTKMVDEYVISTLLPEAIFPRDFHAPGFTTPSPSQPVPPKTRTDPASPFASPLTQPHSCGAISSLHTHPSQHVASSSVSPQPTSNSHLIIWGNNSHQPYAAPGSHVCPYCFPTSQFSVMLTQPKGRASLKWVMKKCTVECELR